MPRTKSDLKARGCKSITHLVEPESENGFDAFIDQQDECVFTMGACHVFAVALRNRLWAAEQIVALFPVLNENGTSHYVVGPSVEGPFADVQLEWMSINDIRVFWQDDTLRIGSEVDIANSQSPETLLAYEAGTDVCGVACMCHHPIFLQLARSKAARYLDAKHAKVLSLAETTAKH